MCRSKSMSCHPNVPQMETSQSQDDQVNTNLSSIWSDIIRYTYNTCVKLNRFVKMSKYPSAHLCADFVNSVQPHCHQLLKDC